MTTHAPSDNRSSPILLVEDNEVNRDMLIRRLKRAGFEVIWAGDGEEALAQMRQHQPSLVLLDINLPIKDGWETCKEAREDSDLCHIPIVALTAHAMESDRVAALEAGFDDYATKPIDFPELVAKIQGFLNA